MEQFSKKREIFVKSLRKYVKRREAFLFNPIQGNKRMHFKQDVLLRPLLLDR